MRRVKVAARRSTASVSVNEDTKKNDARILSLGRHQNPDFVNVRKRASASRSSKRRCISFGSAVTKTRASMTSCIPWKSANPLFSVISPAKTQYYAKWAAELSIKATTEQRLRRFYETLGNVTEVGRPLWQAVILAGAMDPVRSLELRGRKRQPSACCVKSSPKGKRTGRSLAISQSFALPNSSKDCSIPSCANGPWI